MKVDWPLYNFLFFWIPLGALVVTAYLTNKILKKYYVIEEFAGHKTKTYRGDSKVIPVIYSLLIFIASISGLVGLFYLFFFVFIFGRN